MIEQRKGISTFIATLLLMVLAVSAGVVIYAYTMGYLGGFGGTEQLGAMSVDEFKADVSDNLITAYVRNIGKTTVNVSVAYVDGDAYAVDATDPATQAWVSIPENDVLPVYITKNDLSAGITYEVKLIAEDNTQVSFSVKADA